MSSSLSGTEADHSDGQNNGNGKITDAETGSWSSTPITLETLSKRLRSQFGIFPGVNESIDLRLAEVHSLADQTIQTRDFVRNFVKDLLRNPMAGKLFRQKGWRQFRRELLQIMEPLESEDAFKSITRTGDHLAHGGFGKVENFDEWGAVAKFLDPQGGDLERNSQRFHREKKITRYLQKKKIEVGPHLLAEGTDEEGHEFFFMQKIEGNTLEDVLSPEYAM